MPMYLSDYDPDDPPPKAHADEANRLLGIAVGRLLVAVLVALVVGVDVTKFGLLYLFDHSWPVTIVVGWLTLRAGVPLAKGAEHLYCDIRAALA